MGPFMVDKEVTMNLDRDLNPQAFFNFVHYGTGTLTSPGVQASGFIVSSHAKELGEKDWPDYQCKLFITTIRRHAILFKAVLFFFYSDDAWNFNL